MLTMVQVRARSSFVIRTDTMWPSTKHESNGKGSANHRLKLAKSPSWFSAFQRDGRRPRQVSRTFGEGGLLVVERDEVAYAAGVDAAMADVAAGRLIYRWGGHAGHWGHWIVSQLAVRFGVDVSDGFGVCFVTASSMSFDDGYNAVLAAEIDRRHGSGAFRAVFAESRQQTEDALWTAKQAWLECHSDAQPGAARGRGGSS